MKKYLADFNYGHPSIFEFEIVKETEKTVTVDVKTEACILGDRHSMYLPRSGRVLKRSHRVFDNLNGAVAYLQDVASKRRLSLYVQHSDALTLCEELDALMAAIKSKEEGGA